MSKSREISTVLQRDLIPGGTQYQVLQKANSDDYAVIWSTLTTANLTEGNGNLFYSNTRLKTDLQVGVWDIDPELGDTYDLGAHDRHWRDIFVNYVVLEGNLRVNNTFFDTANIAEANNLYFTNTRARAAVGAYGSNLVYYESNGNFQVIVTEGGGGGAVDSVNGLTGVVNLSTTEIPEGANLYFTNARAVAAVSGQDLTLGNITVANLNILGDVLTISSNTLEINDPLIYLAANNYTSDVVDIGFVGNYFDGSQQRHAGLFRDASDSGKFKLFQNYTPEPEVVIDTANASFMLANLEILNLQVLYDVETNRLLIPAGAANGIVFASPNALDYANISLTTSGGDTYLTFHVGDNAGDVFKFYAPSNTNGLQFNDNAVWHAGNDGAGSGLDADLLDGNNSSFYTLTTNQTEGTNLFFTNTRVRAAVGTAAANATGLSYIESTGEFSLADSAVTAGNYGNATLVPQIVVDRYGRITSISNVAVAGGGGGGAVDSVNGFTGTVVLVTDDIAEDGSPVNLWYTDNRAWANTTAGMLVFKTVAVNGVSVVADAWNDTLNLANTTGVTIDGDGGIDTITIGVNANLQNFSAKIAPSTTVAGTGDTQTFTNKTIANVTLTGAINEQVYNLSGTIIDPDNGTVQEKTIAGTTTFTESFLSGQSLILHLTDGNLHSVTWPTMTWVSSNGNVAPTLANKCVIVFWKIGTTLYGAYVGSFVT